MTGLDDAALLAVVAIASALGASALPRATWPRRSPAAAILLWQALGLASGLAAVGTLIGLALPASDGGLVRSVLHAGALLRDGDVFGVAAMFGLSSARTAHAPGAVSAAGAAPAAVSASVPAAGSGGSWPAMILAVRLTCLAAGLALLTL